MPGTFDTIPELAPGASAPYVDKIPVELLGADEPGVYWFGVHALGTNAAGRDGVADGRARTFLPYVPPKDRGRPIDTALVLPLRHQVLHTPDGALADVDDWVETLGEGGRLSSILDFGLAAGGLPITWLVDPAVPDSADALVDGNPARELVERPEGETGAGEEPTDDARRRRVAAPDGRTPGAGPVGRGPGGRRPPVAGQAQPAVTGKQVLALPWGDVDVAAAAKRDVSVYDDARALSGTVLKVGQAPMTAAISAPSGYLDDAAIAVTDPATSILISDRAVIRGEAPSVATYAGHTVVFYSSAVLSGGPGPNDPDSALAMRQQVLSEAALRMDEPGRRPLVVVFPPTWTPPGPDYTQFYDGLDVNWMHLTSLADATAQQPQPLAPDRFSYPQWQVNHEVDDAAFTSLADLTEEANGTSRA